MTGHVISHFCEDRQGQVWIASDDGGLMCFSPSGGRFVSYPNKQLLSECNAHALCVDSRNRLWLGTYSDGVYAMNLDNGQLKHYMPSSNANSLDNPSSYAIFEDSQRRLWVATMNGLNRYNPEDDTFTRVCHMGVLTIDIDEYEQGDLWLSTQGDGLWRYNPKTGKTKQYRYVEKDKTSIPSNEVNTAIVDESGRLWVGTLGGLCYYDDSHDRFVRVPLDIVSQNILSIVEDYGALWIATDRGIVKYVPNEGVQQFTRQDGLSGEQAMANAALKVSSGQIFVGTTSGFSAFFPYRIKANNVMPNVYVTTIEIRNKQLFDDNGLACDLSRTSEVELDYDEAQMVGFSFASLSYCSPKKNQYAYKLEGFDRDWNYVGNQTKATYTNLSAGTYTLHVKATNNDGLWSTNEATLRIVVHPPFWWSWYAKLLYALLICAAIWYYVHMRLRRANRQHQQEMERLSQEKEKEVRDARLNFFTMIAHEIRTPVSLIIGPLGKLMKEGGQPSDDLRVIDRNAHRLLELVNQLLDFRKVEQQRLVMHFEPCDINELVQSVSVRFEPTFSQGGKRFTVECQTQQLTAIVDREAITKVISNLLTNANKYTKDEVRLTCQAEPDEQHFRIVVADNGVGIRQEDQQRIFEPFFQAQDNKPGTGIGLNIVRNIVNQHHGTISVSSEVGQGATFVVTLPMQQSVSAIDLQPVDDQTPEEVLPVQQEVPIENGASEKLPTALVVDDSDDMVEFIASSLRQHYRVITASDGIEALHQLSRHAVSIIVSDWMMPRMDGPELCRRVRRDPVTSHIPIIMLTARTDDDSKVKGMDVGADAYIEKPFSIDYLEACIRNILQIRRQLIEKFSTEPAVPATEIASNQTDNEFMARMTKIIEENMSNSDLSVVFLAEQMGISRSGLFAKIKMMADITPNEMIQVIRLKRAAQLLQTGKYTVSEVGYMVGFSNPSYFTKCFQKQFSIRPLDYMKRPANPRS
jgi:signal transduction histidine kinase/DNA-binding response OmpR family regulator/sugar lactone lactonase YvrE